MTRAEVKKYRKLIKHNALIAWYWAGTNREEARLNFIDISASTDDFDNAAREMLSMCPPDSYIARVVKVANDGTPTLSANDGFYKCESGEVHPIECEHCKAAAAN